MQRYPVFVIGSPRSGTSILVDALLSAGYNGYREGSFLSVISPLNKVVDRHYAVFADNPVILISAIDRDAFKTELWGVAKRFVDRVNPVPPWFDKTGNPEMIEIVPLLRQLWPESVFIFSKRRALENVVSRLKKFPGHNFEYHCKDWARNMATWRDVKSTLPEEIYTEVDQQDMIQNPTEVADRLTALLNLTEESRLEITRTFTSNRPQQTEEGSAARVISLEAISWPDSSKLIFQELCGNELKSYGYSLDHNYWDR